MAAKAEQSTDAGERRLLRVLGLTEAVCRLWVLIHSELDHDCSRLVFRHWENEFFMSITQVIQVSYGSVHGI
jgi:hypothetical protein